MRIRSLLVVAVIAIAVLCSGGIMNAQAVDNSALIAQLQAQIASLIAQIQALQAQQGVSPTWCHTFNSNLGFANSGSSEVEALHTALNKEGASYAPDTGSTYYEGTSHAVIQFQTKYGILQSGYVGPLTRAKLNALYGCNATPSCSTLYWSDSSNTTCSAQKQFCGAYMYQGLHTFATQQACLSSLHPSITITSPNGGETWAQGSAQKITWNTINIPTSNTMHVRLRDSLGVERYVYDQHGDFVAANYGYFDFIVPSTLAPGRYKAEVKTTVNGQSYLDASDNYFTIVSSVPCLSGSGPLLPGQSYCNPTQPSITIISPNGGETWKVGEARTVTWTSSNIPASNSMTIRLRDSSGVEQYFGSLSPSNIGSVSITMPSFVLPGQYRLEVKTQVNNQSYLDASDNYFTITAPTTTCADSDGGTNYNTRGTTTGINTYNEATTSTDYCVYAGQQGTYGQYLQPGQQAVMEYACNSNGKTVYDDLHICPNGCSNGACLQTTQSSITVTSPNGGETWMAGTTRNITWTSTGIPATTDIDIALYKGGSPVLNIIAYAANNGSYSWTIPAVPNYLSAGNDYKIRIRNSEDVTIYDESNNYFTIVAATVICTEANWTSVLSPTTCPSTGQQTKTWTKTGICTGGVGHQYSETVSCNYQAQACTSWTYSAWSPTTCPSSGTQTRTITSSSPSGCAGGSPILTQSCVYIAPAGITVTSPNGTSPITIKSTQNITWTTSSVRSSYVSIGFYGQTGNFLGNIATQTPNDGSYSWTIPVTVTNGTYRIRVSEYGNGAVYGESNNLVFAMSTISPISPVSGNSFEKGSTQNITWTTSGIDMVPYVRLDLYRSSTFVQNIISNISNTGSYSWTIPSSLTVGSQYTIKISSYTDGVVRGNTGFFSISAPTVSTCTVFTYSAWSACSSSGTQTRTVATSSPSGCAGGNPVLSQTCTYVAPTITVALPNGGASGSGTGGDTWTIGSSKNIMWQTTGDITDVKIDLYKGGSFLQTLFASTTNDWSEAFVVPTNLVAGSDYKIRISKYGDASIYDESNAYFPVSDVQPFITITSPVKGDIWARGTKHNITWTSAGFSNLWITLMGGPHSDFYLLNINTSQSASAGSYSWTIPSSVPAGDDYYLHFAGYNGSGISKYSDTFSITASGTASAPLVQNSLASLSEVLAKIVAEIQEMLNK